MTTDPFSIAPRELRKTPRLLFHRPAILHVSADLSIPARTVDISMEGICIAADLSLLPGRLCAVEFNASYTPEPVPLKLEGRVAYCVLAGRAGFRIGFHVPKLDPASKKHVENIMIMQKF